MNESTQFPNHRRIAIEAMFGPYTDDLIAEVESVIADTHVSEDAIYDTVESFARLGLTESDVVDQLRCVVTIAENQVSDPDALARRAITSTQMFGMDGDELESVLETVDRTAIEHPVTPTQIFAVIERVAPAATHKDYTLTDLIETIGNESETVAPAALAVRVIEVINDDE